MSKANLDVHNYVIIRILCIGNRTPLLASLHKVFAASTHSDLKTVSERLYQQHTMPKEKLRVQNPLQRKGYELVTSYRRSCDPDTLGCSPPFLKLSYKKQCRDAVLSIISTFDAI